MKRPLVWLVLFALFAQPAVRVLAHAGHDKAPGDDNFRPLIGPVTISSEAEKNLGLKVEAAELRTIEKTLAALGQVEVDPARVVSLSSRISGRVKRLAVKEGDSVKAGDFLLSVESRQIGDPPPIIEFTAPISGTILDRHAFTGDSVEPDAHLLKVADLSSLYVVARIYEGQIAQVQDRQKVRVRAEAYPDQIFEGTVEGHTAQLDPDTRTLGVRVRVANPDLKLLPNMRATLTIIIRDIRGVIGPDETSARRNRIRFWCAPDSAATVDPLNSTLGHDIGTLRPSVHRHLDCSVGSGDHQHRSYRGALHQPR